MRALLFAVFPLIASCGGQSLEVELDTIGPASTVASTCASFAIGSDGLVRDLWIGAPMLTSDGVTICPRDHKVDHETLSYKNLLENGLCELTKLADTSAARCVLRVTRRSAEPGEDLD